MKEFIKRCLRLILGDRGYDWLRNKYRLFWTSLRKMRRVASRWLLIGKIYPLVYWINSRKPLQEDKVVFIEHVCSKLSDNYKLIYGRLSESGNYDVHVHILKPGKAKHGTKKCLRLVKDAADAKYIFLDDAFNVFGRIHFRQETKIVQVWHACGAFKRFGFGTADKIFGDTRKEMEKYPYYRYCTHVMVSSPEVVWAYSESMNLPKERIFPIGVSRTDVFFDDHTVGDARKRLELLIPKTKKKKVILFAPTFRGRVASAVSSQAFSVPMFFDALRHDYILLIKHHPYVKKRTAIESKYRNFAFDVTDAFDIQELLCVADICISDYSSLIFEYSLFERPMIFFAYDLEDYFDWRGFYYDYDELTPGHICRTNLEMIDYIKHIDEHFDRQRVADFKNKFMSACDGHATERLIDLVFGDEFKKCLGAGGGNCADVSSQAEDADADEETCGQAKDLHIQVSGHAQLEGQDTHGKESGDMGCIPDRTEYPEFPDAAKGDSQGTAGDGIPDAAEREALDEDALEEARLRLYETFPVARDKKKIAYLFTGKSHFGFPSHEAHADWQMIYEYLSTDHVVLYRHPEGLDKKFLPSGYYKSAYRDCTKLLTRQELMGIADIIVTDLDSGLAGCSDLKRAYIYIPDYKKYCRDEESYKGLTEWLKENRCFPGSTKELVSWIQQEDQNPMPFDKKRFTSEYRELYRYALKACSSGNGTKC